MKTFAIIFITCAVVVLGSCGGGGGGSRTTNPATTIGTIAVAGSNQFDTFVEADTGTLTVAPASPLTAQAGATACAADASNAFVAVAYDNSTLVSYQVNTNSSPASVSTGLITGTSPAMAEVGGRLVYVATGTQFNVFSLSTTGALQALPNQVTSSPVVDVVAHPNGQLLLASYNPAAVQPFSVDPIAGTLTPLAPPVNGFGGAGVHTMAFAQNGAFLVVAENVSPAFPIDVLSLNAANGAITRIPSSVNLSGTLFLTPHPNGRFVFAVSANGVTPLAIDATGVVTVGVTVQMSVGTPVRATVDRAGTNLFVAGSGGQLLTFGVDPNTGVVTPHGPAGQNVSFQPVCVVAK